MRALNRFLFIWLVLVIIVSFWIYQSIPFSPIPTPTINSSRNLYSVIKIIDGDTIEVSDNIQTFKVRLIGIDSPEVVDPKKPIQCFGPEASNFAKSILTNQKIYLQSDSTQNDIDEYGRKLRYVYLENGTFFNELMIQKGYAREYTFKNISYKFQSQFKTDEISAREQKIGLWGVCN